MNWHIDGFNQKSWDAIKDAIRSGNYADGNDYFGSFKRGALCFDIVLRDVSRSDGTVEEWLLCADAYLLGSDTGYGYTKRGTPYDEGDGIGLEYDPGHGFEETLSSITKQLDEATQNVAIWKEYAMKTDITWDMEE